MPKIFYTWTCPTCGHVNKFILDEAVSSIPAHEQVIVNCDIDEGGCDEPHAVFIKVKVETEVFALTK